MEPALSAIPSQAVMAVYLDAQGKALLIENVKNVSRQIRPVDMLTERPSPSEGGVVTFQGGGGTVAFRICCINGKCWPCSFIEYFGLQMIRFFKSMFK
jgi:hypothetical protein